MSEYIKYPRTPHLPWSRGASDDDIFVSKKATEHFAQMSEIVITEKMDGENTTLYSDYLHARAIVGIDHPSRTWVKALHGSIKHAIPQGWRICGENLYAKHSIHYNSLDSYFQVFAVFDDCNVCLNWTDTVSVATMLGLITVPLLYKGKWDIKLFKQFDDRIANTDNFEGYVVRNAEAFSYDKYADNIAKYVRINHIKTSEHWRNQAMVINQLRE